MRPAAAPPQSRRRLNPAFDVTPAHLVSALVTEHGVFDASLEGLGALKAALEG